MFQTDIQSQVKDPKQQRLLIVMAVLFVAIGVILYVYVFNPGAFSSSAPPSGGETQGGLLPGGLLKSGAGLSKSDVERIRLDTGIFELPVFKDLTVYSQDIPVKVEEKGNPYAFRKIETVSLVPVEDPSAESSFPPEF